MKYITIIAVLFVVGLCFKYAPETKHGVYGHIKTIYSIEWNDGVASLIKDQPTWYGCNQTTVLALEVY